MIVQVEGLVVDAGAVRAFDGATFAVVGEGGSRWSMLGVAFGGLLPRSAGVGATIRSPGVVLVAAILAMKMVGDGLRDRLESIRARSLT